MADSSQGGGDAAGTPFLSPLCPRPCAPRIAPSCHACTFLLLRTPALHLCDVYYGMSTATAPKKSGERGMLPVTIKQIQEAVPGEDDGFTIDGRETNQITFVAQIINVEEAVRRFLPCSCALYFSFPCNF